MKGHMKKKMEFCYKYSSLPKSAILLFSKKGKSKVTIINCI